MMIDLPAPVSPVSTLKPGARLQAQPIDDGEIDDGEFGRACLFHEAQARGDDTNAERPDRRPIHSSVTCHRAEHAKTQGVHHFRHRRPGGGSAVMIMQAMTTIQM